MEKIKYMFMAVLVALVSMTVTSCSDDDDDESVVNSLVNTTWTYSETNGDDDHLVITDETFTFSQSTARYTVTTIVKKVMRKLIIRLLMIILISIQMA